MARLISTSRDVGPLLRGKERSGDGPAILTWARRDHPRCRERLRGTACGGAALLVSRAPGISVSKALTAIPCR
jgi:hypothetical protein